MKLLFILFILLNFVFADISLLSTTQKANLLSFINANATYIKLSNGVLIRDSNTTINLDEVNLTIVNELNITTTSITTLIDELGYMGFINKLYFDKTTLTNRTIPSTFYMLDANYTKTYDGNLTQRNTNETINEFFARSGWNRINNSPVIIEANISKTFIQRNETINVQMKAGDSDGYLRNYKCDFNDGYVLPNDYYVNNILEKNTTKSISHSFYYDGTFDINCSVKDDNGAITFKIFKVYVSNTPIKAYSLNPKIQKTNFSTNQSIYFDLTYENNTSFTYLWNFGDGTTKTERNPIHKFVSAGNYYITCQITNSSNGNISHGGLTISVSDLNAYEEIINLNKEVFETTAEWQSRIEKFSKDIEIDVVLSEYNSDTKTITFLYDLSSYYIDDANSKSQPLAIEESKYLYEKILNENNITKATVTLKAKIESNTIKLYPDKFFFNGTSKDCNYFTNTELNVFIDEFKKARFESIISHKNILREFNADNKRFCFKLDFIAYNPEDKRLYADLNLGEVNLSNQKIMVDIESKDRGKNIEHFKDSMKLELPFNVIYGENDEYRVVLEENLSIIHPSMSYTKFYFVETNLTSEYLNSLKSILRRGEVDYEDFSNWDERVKNFERVIVIEPKRDEFNYSSNSKKLKFILDLTYLNKGFKIYEIPINSQLEAREVFDNSKAILKLKSYLDGGLIKFEIKDVKFRYNTREYFATELNETIEIPEYFDLNLSKGWNLSANPIKDKINDLSIFGDYQSIWMFNEANLTWFNPSSIEYEKGFWINLNEDKQVNFYGLTYSPVLALKSKGWHLIGTGKDIDINSINQSQIWLYRDEKWLNKSNLTIIKKGEGFWVKNP